MEKRNMSSFGLRTISSAIMAPVVIGAIYFGNASFFLLLLAVGAMWAWEWSTMVPNKKPAFYAICYTLVMGASICFPISLLWLSIIVGVGLLTFYKARKEEHPRLLLLGVPYIALGMGSLMWINVAFGWNITMWLILTIWSVDVGGYLVGSKLKGPKLAPKISPNKTWSGLVGGVVLSALVSAIFIYAFELRGMMLGYFIICAVALAVIAQIGDLCESAIKRRLNLKDASDLIPGHGGIFDRIDGLVVAAPVLYVVVLLLRVAL